MRVWSYIQRDGTRLALTDFGGSGPPVLLLHGLAGHAEEWSETASWLTGDHRVFALDLRGHGRSERRPQHSRQPPARDGAHPGGGRGRARTRTGADTAEDLDGAPPGAPAAEVIHQTQAAEDRSFPSKRKNFRLALRRCPGCGKVRETS